ncbi:flagellar biosynthesis protein flip [Leptolinea tardivitalis]|uniref:Flagellar biosynthetic protein FliP n=2 Tax=Leptolinea tardivitalis TaxID=229920 RepID=A0A0P6XJ25_9CHLR|nr:flagellar biosynthesis protein flip [Leptolinea tardivitalis]
MVLTVFLSGCAGISESTTAPGVSLTLNPTGQPKEITSGVQLLVLLTVLSLAPSILILATSFTRIVIVLSMLRNAIGTPTAPPNQVIIGLALLLTFFSMSPIINKVNNDAIKPYSANQIDQETFLKKAVDPFREFMFKNTREKDIELFLAMSNSPRPNSLQDIDTVVLMPAFVISELKTAFTMGFVIYVPFLIIDMVVSSILLSMGMMMMPPSLVSLPFKLLLFVMVDGWYLITRSLLLSFK